MGSVSAIALVFLYSATADVQLLFFSSQACLPCQQVKPVVSQMLNEGYPIVPVDIDQRADLANRYQVRQIPCFVLTVGGQEVSRVVGNRTATGLKAWMQTALSQSQLAVNPSNITLPNIAPPAMTSSERFRTGESPQNSANYASEDNRVPTEHPASADRWSENNRLVSTSRLSMAQRNALSSTVRIHVEEPQAFAVGTGTVIDQEGGSILILTCGHLFRESGQNARIKIDAGFPDQPVTGLDARVLFYDSETHDVALVVAHTERTFRVAKIAPPQLVLNVGDQVFAAGCSGGDAPSILPTRIKALTNYSGVVKIDTYRRPEQGRSGGGLFSAGGQLIGVCNAAAVQVDEGIYAGLQGIYAALDATNLRTKVLTPDVGLFARSPGPNRTVAEPTRTPVRQTNEVSNPLQSQILQPVSTERGPREITVLIQSVANSGLAEVVTISNPSEELMRMIRAEKNGASGGWASNQNSRPMTLPPQDANVRAQSPEASPRR